MKIQEYEELKAVLLAVADKHRNRYELSKRVGDDFYDPDLMQNMDQYYADYNDETNTVIIRTIVKGLRYDNRSLHLDRLHVGDRVSIVRDKLNAYNFNNFCYFTPEGIELGYMDAELCNAIAPLFDKKRIIIESGRISYIEQIWERLRYAKQGVLFIEMVLRLRAPKE